MLKERNKEPSSISKLAIGILFAAFAYVILLIPGYISNEPMNLIWIVLFNMFLSAAELLIVPIGLSLISKLAPQALRSLMMGVVFAATAVAKILSGLFASALPINGETGMLLGIIPISNLASFLWIFVIISGAMCIICLISKNKIKKMMPGIE